MADAHDRSAHVLDPAYLVDLDGISIEEPARQARRVRGARDRGLVRAPPHPGPHRHPRGRGRAPSQRGLARGPHQPPARRSSPTRARAGTRRRAGSRSRWRPSRTPSGRPAFERFDGVLANLPTLSADELQEAIAGLRVARARGLRPAARAVRGDRPHRPRAGRTTPLNPPSPLNPAAAEIVRGQRRR